MKIGNPIPYTQYQPILCEITAVIKPNEIPFRRRYNIIKADWNNFSKNLDSMISSIKSILENYDAFTALIKPISMKNIG